MNPNWNDYRRQIIMAFFAGAVAACLISWGALIGGLA